MKCPACGSSGELLFSSFACDRFGCVNGPRVAPTKKTDAGDSLWMALHTRSGVEVPNERSYSRVSLAGTMYEDRDGFVNLRKVVFHTATGTWAGGQPITHFAMYWAPSGGECFYESSVNPPTHVVNGGNTPAFAAGQVAILKVGMLEKTVKRLREECS